MSLNAEVIDTDLLIVGSEGAGARAAIEASEHDIEVTIVTKGRIGRSGATVTAVMDMAVDSKSALELLGLPGDPNDSKEIFFRDIVVGGGYLSNQKLVETVVNDAPQRSKELQDWGLRWVDLFRMPGHSYPRSAWSSGLELMRVLRRKVNEIGIEVIEDTMVTDILQNGNRVAGAVAVDIRTGELIVFKAKSIILSTGGGMRIYTHTTAPEELTGDGYAMAYRAGVELIDMEFPQFIPVSFISPMALDGIEYGAYGLLLDIDGRLLNRWGERFLEKWDPERLERSTRDTVAKASAVEILEERGGTQGGVYISVAHLPDKILKNYLRWKRGWLDHKPGLGFILSDFIDLIKEKVVEVAPSCHYFCGGVKINENWATSLPGFYVAGEVAGGVDGGNRLSGVAITQVLVGGVRAARFAAEYAMKAKDPHVEKEQVKDLQKRIFAPLERREGLSPIDLRHKIQKLAWEKVGIVRNGTHLKEAIEEIKIMRAEDIPKVSTRNKGSVYNREWVEALQLENMLCTLEMIARAALMRTESRACHLRTDYSTTDKNWVKNILIKLEDGEMKLSTQPVLTTKLKPETSGK